jgi:P4 family phage/plasmid primase-like protien
MNGADFYSKGYSDIISVTPPNAKLAPSSKLSSAQTGKVPGKRLSNGLWVGYDWRGKETTAEDARQWDADGANIGLRAGNFPAIDIDCDHLMMSETLSDEVFNSLGTPPLRVGRSPKKLLMFRTEEPFTRMRLWFNFQGKQHLVEILGEGQQYVVAGVHPATLLPYKWLIEPPPASDLPVLTREAARAFLERAATRVENFGGTVMEIEGEGKLRSDAPPQDDLRAPSIEAVAEAVSYIRNSNALFADRSSYLKMGYAIKAALPDLEDEALALFVNWALTWEGNDRAAGNTVDGVASDWKRMKPPYSVGWSWIAELGQKFGFSAARVEFPAIPAPDKPSPDDKTTEVAVLTDHWLVEQLVKRTKSKLRFVPETGKFLVWDGTRWHSDATMLAESMFIDALKQLSTELPGMAEFNAMRIQRKQTKEKMLAEILSAGKVWALMRLAQADRSIAISISQLDADPLLLNTPSGMVNLATGEVLSADPDALCSRVTACSAVEPDPTPLWDKFLYETTGGDLELELYLQRLLGYSLTGLTKEQHLSFIWGDGGNGKSVFINVVTRIMGDYWAQADSGTFVQSRNDKHPADLASLVGARLVTASETQEGRAWDEQRIKAVTGGDPMSARLLFKDFFTFRPTFKLIFIGNYKPILKGTGAAMRRRMHLVPFTNKPPVVDMDLEQKLLGESPGILAWMIRGCAEWQKRGLAAPESVTAATEEYFEEEDTFGAWIEERLVYDGESFTSAADLYQSWNEFAHARGEWVGTIKRLSSNLKARGIPAVRTAKERGFAGLKLNPDYKPFGGL